MYQLNRKKVSDLWAYRPKISAYLYTKKPEQVYAEENVNPSDNCHYHTAASYLDT
jgi:hypothetical protein